MQDQYCLSFIKLLVMNRLASVLAFSLFTLCTYIPCSAQWLEVGFAAGASNYMGDLVEGHLAPNEYNPAFGVFGRYQMSPFLSFRAYVNKAELTGSDTNNRDLGLRRRNLNFKTNIVELGFVNEISITPYNPRDDKDALPYVYVGVSGFYYNPQAEYQGEFYDLRPLGTEGQGNLISGSKPYSKFAFAVPFGIGFKWNVSSLVNLGIDFGMRMTITDYIDDVSGEYPNLELLAERNPLAATLSFRGDEFDPSLNSADFKGGVRGNSENSDWYFVGTVSLSINLTDEYGMEWDPKFRSFSDEPVPKRGSYIVRSKSVTKKPTKKSKKKSRKRPKRKSRKKSKKKTSGTKSRTINK